MMPPSNQMIIGVILITFGAIAMQQLGFDFRNLTIEATIAALVAIAGLYLFFKNA